MNKVISNVLFKNFDVFSQSEKNIDNFKSLIFQLAIKGKPDSKKLSNGRIKKPVQTLIQKQKTYHRKEAMKYNAIQANFNSGFIALNLPWRSNHILRHSYATVTLMATNSISAVQASLGHTSSQITERYVKVVALLDKGVTEKTARVFDIFGKSPPNVKTGADISTKNRKTN